MRGMSDDPHWSYHLPYGLPSNFDYSVIRTPDDATRMICALPNADRGGAAVGLYEARDTIGNEVAYHGMRAAWGHDDGYVAVAFGAKEQFADCLSEVAPPLGLQKSLRVWRGVQMEDGEHPADGAFGISWTRSRDVACWFALRFELPKLRPFVFQVDLDPYSLIPCMMPAASRR